MTRYDSEGIGFKATRYVVALVLLLSAGCVSGKRGLLPVVYVDQASNGAQIDLAPGQEMVIQLITNIRERMSWVMVGEIDTSILEPYGQRTVETLDSDGRSLVRPREDLRFRAKSNGEVILNLAYMPEGGTLAQSTNMFELRIIVDRFRHE